MKVINVVGARPNFMKIAPIIRAIKSFNQRNQRNHRNQINQRNQTNQTNQRNQIDYLLIHTGQHYDYEMSKVFFEDLEIPEPDIYLGVGSGTHAEQTGRVMIEFEKVLFQEKPDLVIVVGDVNSTLACALVASKNDYIHSDINHRKERHSRKSGNPERHWIPGQARNDELYKTYVVMYSKESGANGQLDAIKGEQISVNNLINSKNSINAINARDTRPLIAHVEAGLRSFDRTMPEEINRLLTDQFSDFLFTPSPDANENLRKEGIPEEKILLVGNVMVDSLLFNLEIPNYRCLALTPKKLFN
jgi:UDP-N-acetylglucosamine 2-epimerase (non-hydrolysing)